MKKIPIKKDKFLSTCVTMVMSLDKLEIDTQVLFMVELIKLLEPEGLAVRSEVEPVICRNLAMKRDYFRQVIHRLELSDHLRVEGGIIYPHPKYVALRGCEGNLLICSE